MAFEGRWVRVDGETACDKMEELNVVWGLKSKNLCYTRAIQFGRGAEVAAAFRAAKTS